MITIAINVILYNTLGNNKVTGEEQQTNIFVCSRKQISTESGLLYGQQESCIVLSTSLSCF